MRALKEVPGARIVAVCDVWDKHLEAGKNLAEPGAFATKDHRELLARKDVDAVIIGAPDHRHVPLTIDACAAGKDVYVEKPLTHEPVRRRGGDRGPKRISPRRAGRHAAAEHAAVPERPTRSSRAGQLGDIHKVHLTWNRNQPRWLRDKYWTSTRRRVDWKRFLGTARQQPFDEYRFRNWRWFWDFGGGIFTDLMVHHVDIAHWFLDLDHPQTAASIGDSSRPRAVGNARHGADPAAVSRRQVQVYFEGTFVNARNGEMLEFMGSEATLYLDRGATRSIRSATRKSPPAK